MANLLTLDKASLTLGPKLIFDNVTLGVSDGERIGIVGANGSGKTTLLNLIAGVCSLDSGRVVLRGDVTIAYCSQEISADNAITVTERLSSAHPQDSPLVNPMARAIIAGLGLGDFLESPVCQLSGGQQRRVDLAAALLTVIADDKPESRLLLLDEPTNHLDIDTIQWLASYLTSAKISCIFVSHDRWFLDEVATRTLEVLGARVLSIPGGYQDWIFARAERERKNIASADKRNNLLRKELAWLRRGAPARTSKPKFRIEAAQSLIMDEPSPRDAVSLVQLAQKRLGKMVMECHNVSLEFDKKTILRPLEWSIAPGARIGIIGANGSGKTSLLSLLTAKIPPTTGIIKQGKTVCIGYLSQHHPIINHSLTILEAIQEIAHFVTMEDKEFSAAQIALRLGFSPAEQQTCVADLSGGQLKRLALTRIMMQAPNVLILDEPTNDLDIDILVQLEDLLDSFAGTLIVISHDRFFIERVCDDIYTIYRGELTHLPVGVEQYFTLDFTLGRSASNVSDPTPKNGSASVNDYEKHKNIRKIEQLIDRLTSKKIMLEGKMNEPGISPTQLMALAKESADILSQITEAEEQWYELTEEL